MIAFNISIQVIDLKLILRYFFNDLSNLNRKVDKVIDSPHLNSLIMNYLKSFFRKIKL